jgi:argininosuccinate lyase
MGFWGFEQNPIDKQYDRDHICEELLSDRTRVSARLSRLIMAELLNQGHI